MRVPRVTMRIETVDSDEDFDSHQRGGGGGDKIGRGYGKKRGGVNLHLKLMEGLFTVHHCCSELCANLLAD